MVDMFIFIYYFVRDDVYGNDIELNTVESYKIHYRNSWIINNLLDT